MSEKSLIFLELLLEAQRSPHGIAVSHPTAHSFKRELSMFKVEHPEFSDISVCVSPDRPATEVWLVKGYKNPMLQSKKFGTLALDLELDL